MMKKKVCSPYRKLKLLLVLPLMAIMMYAFAKPVYTYSDVRDIRESTAPGRMIKDISGTVVKEDGTPLAGVTVNVSGTSLSVTTDESGKFHFNDLPGYIGLMFTAGGYEPVSITAESSRNAKVIMKANPLFATMGTLSRGELVVVDSTISDFSLDEATKKLGKNFGKLTFLTRRLLRKNTVKREPWGLRNHLKKQGKRVGPEPCLTRGRMRQISPHSGVRVTWHLPIGWHKRQNIRRRLQQIRSVDGQG